MNTTRASPPLRHSCISGEGIAITVPAAISLSVMSWLAWAKRRFSCSVLDKAFTTRMPVMFSRMTRTTTSSRRCTRLYIGRPLADTTNTTRISTGSMATRIMAKEASITSATHTPPMSSMGARTQRVWNCCTADWTL